ncbi:hypothetical protein QCN29_13410 [Streptomyces sp. HNM0663]|uniref:Uncharacterized protein n=1 Tax=Streptomyces chengmaiensis TaxID=3040919 RepID=A0ABT6HM11_9ACTN|nr:hypothetical protein [Streptomyces chengmaiensis]MDH2389774.1 hypothetical protein [Streptomyces chengmaiensis]
MPLITLAIEQFVQWRYGFTAALGVTLLSIGLKTENGTCAGIGGVLLIAPVLQTGS